MSLEVMYERCAGIDVHQRFVVVCLTLMEGGKRRQEIRTFRNETADLLARLSLVTARTMHTCRHGKHGRVLDAGVPTSGGLLRAGRGQCTAYQSRERREKRTCRMPNGSPVCFNTDSSTPVSCPERRQQDLRDLMRLLL